MDKHDFTTPTKTADTAHRRIFCKCDKAFPNFLDGAQGWGYNGAFHHVITIPYIKNTILRLILWETLWKPQICILTLCLRNLTLNFCIQATPESMQHIKGNEN